MLLSLAIATVVDSHNPVRFGTLENLFSYNSRVAPPNVFLLKKTGKNNKALTRLVGKLSVTLVKYLESKWNSIISKYTPWYLGVCAYLFFMTGFQE